MKPTQIGKKIQCSIRWGGGWRRTGKKKSNERAIEKRGKELGGFENYWSALIHHQKYIYYLELIVPDGLSFLQVGAKTPVCSTWKGDDLQVRNRWISFLKRGLGGSPGGGLGVKKTYPE